MYKVFPVLANHSNNLQKISKFYATYGNTVNEMVKLKTVKLNEILDPKVLKIKDKIIYSDYIQYKRLKLNKKKRKQLLSKLSYMFRCEENDKIKEKSKASVALKYLEAETNSNNTACINSTTQPSNENCFETHEIFNSDSEKIVKSSPNNKLSEKYAKLYGKYLSLMDATTTSQKKKKNIIMRLGDDLSNVPSDWMKGFELYDDALDELDDVELQELTNLQNVDPDKTVSNVPCGGCGALLQCNSISNAGYLPTEIFLNKSDEDLKSLTCQRCHFMNHYNTCIDVNVSAEEYPQLLQVIKTKKCAIILVIDLTDFPCSIWPDLSKIITKNKDLFIVANKADLLPKDSTHFEENVKDCIVETLIQLKITNINLQSINIVSAKTGYGIEELINKLQNVYNYRGDVYLIGCTNVGKSSLFNTLLSSDYCKSRAQDLVQRATVSQWPGTTLNLLKFPLLCPTQKRLWLRTKRLIEERKNKQSKEFLKYEMVDSVGIEKATLSASVGLTFKLKRDLDIALRNNSNLDLYSYDDGIKYTGLNEESKDLLTTKWCYDTPGLIQPDQILHYLTTEELKLTLPNKIISPRSLILKNEQTVFIAGLGRLDVFDTSNFIRITVFASDLLPITVCKTADAHEVYNELLKSEAFKVPINDPNRLKMWPKLRSKALETFGIARSTSCCDVVLSSAGWISIAGDIDQKINLTAWTPNGKGIYLRTPSLLPKSIALRGDRLPGTPIYKYGRQVCIR